MRRFSLINGVIARRQRKPEPRRREVQGVALLALGTLLLTCLLTYDRSDVGREATGRAVHNLAGPAGARVAGWLLDFAGLAALLLPVALLRVGARRFSPARQAGGGARVAAGFAVAIVSACSLLALYRPRAVSAWVREPGGAVGALIAFALTAALNRTGALIVLGAALAIGLRLLIQTSFEDLARRAAFFVARPARSSFAPEEPPCANGEDREDDAPGVHRMQEDNSRSTNPDD